jgi:hypothetical protein
MSPTPSIPPIRSGQGVEFRLHEMLASRAAVPASAKDPDLVYKV